MTTINFNALDQWKMLPIYSAELYYSESDTTFILENLVKGSFASLVPIFSSRKTNKGVQHISAFKLNCRFITSQSNIADFQALFSAIKNETLSNLIIRLLSADSNIVYEVQSGDPALVRDMGATFDISYSDDTVGPVITIDAQALLSTDILTESNFLLLFTQSWG